MSKDTIAAHGKRAAFDDTAKAQEVGSLIGGKSCFIQGRTIPDEIEIGPV